MLSQQALQTFWESHLESSTEITQTKRLTTVATQIDSPHPTKFTTSPSNLVQHAAETPTPSTPSPLNPVHDLLEVNDTSPTGWSESDGFSTNGDTHSSYSGSRSLSPKVKKHTKSHKSSPRPKSRSLGFKLSLAKQEVVSTRKNIQIACFFCRSRKIACGPPLPGDPNHTCE